MPGYGWPEIADRLAAYEDTGLEPTEIEQLKYCYTNLEKDVDSFGGSFYRARNLLKAEAEGRLYVLPRAGDVTVERDGLQYIGDHWNPPVLTAFADDQTTRSGKRVGFISPRDAEEAVRTKQEEAEAALRKEQG